MTAATELTASDLTRFSRHGVPVETARRLAAAGHIHLDIPGLHRAAQASGSYEDALLVACILRGRAYPYAALREILRSGACTGTARLTAAGVSDTSIITLLTSGEIPDACSLLDMGLSGDDVDQLAGPYPRPVSMAVMVRLVHSGLTVHQITELLDRHPTLYSRVVTSLLDMGLSGDDILELDRMGVQLDSSWLVLPEPGEGTMAHLPPRARQMAALLVLTDGMLVDQACLTATAIDRQPWRDLMVRLMLDGENPSCATALTARAVEADTHTKGLGPAAQPGHWKPITPISTLTPRPHLSAEDLDEHTTALLGHDSIDDLLTVMRAGADEHKAARLLADLGRPLAAEVLLADLPYSALPWSVSGRHWYAAAINRGVTATDIIDAEQCVGAPECIVALALGADPATIRRWAEHGANVAVTALLIEFGYSEAAAIEHGSRTDPRTVLLAASLGVPEERLASVSDPNGADLSVSWPDSKPLSPDVLRVLSDLGVPLTDPAVLSGLDLLTDPSVPVSVLTSALELHAARRVTSTKEPWVYHPIEWDLLLTIASLDQPWGPELARQARKHAGRTEQTRHLADYITASTKTTVVQRGRTRGQGRGR